MGVRVLPRSGRAGELHTYLCLHFHCTSLRCAQDRNVLYCSKAQAERGEAEEGLSSLVPLSAQNKFVLTAFAAKQAREQQHQCPPRRW